MFSFRPGIVGLLCRHSPFPVYVEGPAITIYTDHKPLTYALGKVADIRHVPGVDNVVADTLSRPPSHITGPDSRSHTARPDSCLPALHNQPALHIAAVSPSAELLDYVIIAKNHLKCPSTRRL
jgi:hypothetical protein